MDEPSPPDTGDTVVSVSGSANRFALLALLALTYFAAGKIGLRFAIISPSAAAIWAPAGIALAACLLCGVWVWPAIFIGAFFVNVTTAGSIATSTAIACGNTLEAVLGAYLVIRFANGADAFGRNRDALKFLILAAALSTTVSATIGVTSLCLAGFASWSEYKWIWLTWWLGDAAGELLVAPLILLWGLNYRLGWSRAQKAEAVLLLLVLLTLGGVMFDGWLPLSSQRYPLEFLFFPVLLWAAFRFGPRETATVNFIASGIALVGTLRGLGPFAGGSRNEALLLLQTFSGFSQIMGIAVATEIAQRRSLDISQRVAREAAEDANRAKDEFLAMLGHELRNPLNTIALAVPLLGEERTTEGGTIKARNIIARQVRHLTRMVDDLLDVSRVTTGKIVLVRRPLNLADLVSEGVNALHQTGQLAQRAVEMDVAPVWVDGDADRLTQIVTNLLSNAAKYTASDGTIRVSVKAQAQHAVIRVEDNGIGVPADLLPRIFDLFVRGDVGLARFQGGLGLGLTLVRRLVELHGGSVEALSQGADRGSTFIVRFPEIPAPTTSENKPFSLAGE